MKKFTLIATLAVTVQLVGCSEARVSTNNPRADRQQVAIRLEGVNRGEYSAVLLSVHELRAFAAGQPLETKLARPNLDLGVGDHAYLVGYVTVPENTRELDVTVVLDASGSYKSTGGDGDIDARGVPIRFSAPMELIEARRHAVVKLEVAESMLGRGGEKRGFLPEYQVRY